MRIQEKYFRHWGRRFELRVSLFYGDILFLLLIFRKIHRSYFRTNNLKKNRTKISLKNFLKNWNFRQKFAKSLAHVDFQTLAGFTNLRHTKNGQCFAHDCIVALKWGKFLSKVWNRKRPPLLASKDSYRLRFHLIFGETLLNVWLNALCALFQKIRSRVFRYIRQVHAGTKIL